LHFYWLFEGLKNKYNDLFPQAPTHSELPIMGKPEKYRKKEGWEAPIRGNHVYSRRKQ
jgi:hypothetical protein